MEALLRVPSLVAFNRYYDLRVINDNSDLQLGFKAKHSNNVCGPFGSLRNFGVLRKKISLLSCVPFSMESKRLIE
jgi:hypothetical protein